MCIRDRLREAERRRDQQRKFKEAYEAKVQQVAHQCALDLPLESIPLAVRELMKRVQAAQQNQSAKEEVLKQLERAQRNLRELQEHAAQSKQRPVSYTHLDVYKRQPTRSRKRPRRPWAFPRRRLRS